METHELILELIIPLTPEPHRPELHGSTCVWIF